MEDNQQEDHSDGLDIIAAKRCLRQEIKERLKILTEEECQKADREIGKRLFGLETWREVDMVFCYISTGWEVDTSTIIARVLEEGKRVGVPLCTAPGVMEVRQIEEAESLIPGLYGIPEPKRDCPLIDPEEIHLAVVPGLSLTADGFRLGYGGGYYDRHLPRVGGLKLAPCREKRLSSQLPMEPHDIPIDDVPTEHSARVSFHSVRVRYFSLRFTDF